MTETTELTDEPIKTTPAANADQAAPAAPTETTASVTAPPAATEAVAGTTTPVEPPPDDAGFDERLERLGGEPAPVITPEEFARLQRAGQVHIDARGRVRAARRNDAEAGVSLKKRRAWYAS